MKTILHILSMLVLASITSLALAGERVGDFALIDNQGTQHHMSWYNDQNAVVILPHAIGSADSDALTKLQQMKETYATKGAVFFLMNCLLYTSPSPRD